MLNSFSKTFDLTVGAILVLGRHGSSTGFLRILDGLGLALYGAWYKSCIQCFFVLQFSSTTYIIVQSILPLALLPDFVRGVKVRRV